MEFDNILEFLDSLDIDEPFVDEQDQPEIIPGELEFESYADGAGYVVTARILKHATCYEIEVEGNVLVVDRE